MGTHFLNIFYAILLFVVYFELSDYFSFGSRERRKTAKLELEERLQREAERKKQFQEWYARRQKQIRLALYIGRMDASWKPERVWKPERAKLVGEYLSEMRVDNPAATLNDVHEDIVEISRTPVFSTW